MLLNLVFISFINFKIGYELTSFFYDVQIPLHDLIVILTIYTLHLSFVKEVFFSFNYVYSFYHLKLFL